MSPISNCKKKVFIPKVDESKIPCDGKYYSSDCVYLSDEVCALLNLEDKSLSEWIVELYKENQNLKHTIQEIKIDINKLNESV